MSIPYPADAHCCARLRNLGWFIGLYWPPAEIC